ncbi:pilin [Patescibacteria group bacterium]|nr:pilin [Patescibacteria group bacterium]MBU0963901.1 pilin [Patescibacteria group bacterium]
MKKYLWQIIGSISILILGFSQLVKHANAAIGFDNEGNIKKATNLTDKSPKDITIQTIQWALGFLGLVAVVLILYGGITWMTSAGNEEKVKKAKDILKMAVIGMIVVLLAWALVTFVFTTIQQ